jgi:hypothetical protein
MRMPWEPMSLEEARAILEEPRPNTRTMPAGEFAQLLEAKMVDEGATAEQIKAAIEAFVGAIE